MARNTLTQKKSYTIRACLTANVYVGKEWERLVTCAGVLVKNLPASFRKGFRMGVCCQRPVRMTPGCRAKAWTLLPCVLQQSEQAHSLLSQSTPDAT